ncbi:hypothetical protein V8E52_007158 [Russula decolorans]
MRCAIGVSSTLAVIFLSCRYWSHARFYPPSCGYIGLLHYTDTVPVVTYYIERALPGPQITDLVVHDSALYYSTVSPRFGLPASPEMFHGFPCHSRLRILSFLMGQFRC